MLWRPVLPLQVWVVFACTCRILRAAEEIITKEVCHLETFEASCPQLHVILLDQALYGSMELNRCITTAFGYEGCQADVLPLLDRECSGREQCSFSVTKLHGRQYSGANICPAELTSYLFVRYTCKRVLGCDTLTCQSAGLLKPEPMKVGTLASEVTLTTGCGSPSCPWVLEAQPGQLFNLSLIDLWPRNEGVVGVTDVPGPYCHRYASITEHGYTSKDITSCGPDYRRRATVYHSHTNRVTVSIYEPRTEGVNMRFLIVYRVIRCPDMEGPPDAVVSRHGDQMKVKCKHSAKSWTLVCQGTAWVGEIGLCDSAQTGADDTDGRSSPFGMLIVVGLGVALGVLIGMVLLVVVFVLMKRRRRREFLSRQNTLLSDFSPSRDNTNNKLGDRGSTLPPGGVVRYIPDHSFTATIQLKRPDPCLDQQDQQEFTLLTSDCVDDDMGKTCNLGTCPSRCNEKNCIYGTSPNRLISSGYPVWQAADSSVDKTKLDIFAKDSCRNVPEARN